LSKNIFSTYSTGENRVTASIVAVLDSLAVHRIERLLGAVLEQPEFELVKFENQPSGGSDSVPDALIFSSCRLLIETKLRKNAVNPNQLERHLQQIQSEHAKEAFRRLLVLTPDDQPPVAFAKIDDTKLVWSSFSALYQASWIPQ